MKFTIETVSKMTGISAPSLRNWEKRYGFPQPIRTDGGHRFYSSADIEFLKRAASWIEEGYNLSQVGEFYKATLRSDPFLEVSTKLEQKLRIPEVLAATIGDDVSYRVDLMYEALIKYDLPVALKHYCILNAKLSPEQLFDRVFEPILRRAGSEWCDGRISIGQEHYASSFVRLRLAAFLTIEIPLTADCSILAATTGGELHEGGLMVLAAHLKFRGYPVYYFGASLPLDGLQTICRELKPKVVALSYQGLDQLRQDLPVLAELEVSIVIGGPALGDQVQVDILMKRHAKNIHFCQKTLGSEAAQFVDLICRAK